MKNCNIEKLKNSKIVKVVQLKKLKELKKLKKSKKKKKKKKKRNRHENLIKYCSKPPGFHLHLAPKATHSIPLHYKPQCAGGGGVGSGGGDVVDGVFPLNQ